MSLSHPARESRLDRVRMIDEPMQILWATAHRWQRLSTRAFWSLCLILPLINQVWGLNAQALIELYCQMLNSHQHMHATLAKYTLSETLCVCQWQATYLYQDETFWRTHSWCYSASSHLLCTRKECIKLEVIQYHAEKPCKERSTSQALWCYLQFHSKVNVQRCCNSHSTRSHWFHRNRRSHKPGTCLHRSQASAYSRSSLIYILESRTKRLKVACPFDIFSRRWVSGKAGQCLRVNPSSWKIHCLEMSF